MEEPDTLLLRLGYILFGNIYQYLSIFMWNLRFNVSRPEITHVNELDHPKTGHSKENVLFFLTKKSECVKKFYLLSNKSQIILTQKHQRILQKSAEKNVSELRPSTQSISRNNNYNKNPHLFPLNRNKNHFAAFNEMHMYRVLALSMHTFAIQSLKCFLEVRWSL